MQSFLAKCAAVGIVAGGFTLTGDVARIAERGQRLLDARTVPSDTPAKPSTVADVDSATGSESAHPAEPADSVTAPVAAPEPAAATPEVLKPRNPLFDAPLGRAVAVPAPPAQGPDSIDLRQLPAGSRVLVWVKRQGAAGRGRSMELLRLDLIDPNTGEALEHRHADMTHGSESTTVHAAPRRIVISLDSRGRLAKGAMLRLAPLHGVNGLGAEESVGQVMAIDIQGS
jgi:hypothetical protein